MADDNLRQLVGHGLAAMRAGTDMAAKATAEISKDATHPALKAALEEGNGVSQRWAQRLDEARRQVGEAPEQDNPVMEAHYEVSRRIRQHAPDDVSRDLGIIAGGQLALHYWIASFGTMAGYAGHLGMDETARDMKACTDEARQADQAHTDLAVQLMRQD